MSIPRFIPVLLLPFIAIVGMCAYFNLYDPSPLTISPSALGIEFPILDAAN